jgi:hypothetical protein
VPLLLAENESPPSLGRGSVAVTIHDGSDHNGHIGTDKADLLDNGLPVDVVERAGLKLSHDPDEAFQAFRPTSVDIDEICVRGCILRVGELLGIVIVPRYVRICKECSESLILTAILCGQI